MHTHIFNCVACTVCSGLILVTKIIIKGPVIANSQLSREIRTTW